MNLKKIFGLCLGFILFVIILYSSPFEEIGEKGNKVLACSALIIIWWITSPIPLAATSLLPIILFPVLGIANTKTVTSSYASPVIYLFLGGFLIAIAIEKWQLHKRIALKILTLTGSTNKGIIIGFIISTSFISMWMSNTATTVMMLPIATSVIEILSKKNNSTNEINFSKILIISIAYSATIGGLTTVIGSPPNGLMVAFIEETYNYTINFHEWTLITMPFVFIMLILQYLIFIYIVFPIKTQPINKEAIYKEIDNLGKISYEEKILMIIFILTASLWIFRPFLNRICNNSLISDASIAIFAALLLFIIPSKKNPNKAILEWDTAKHIPWGVLILFGGGLAMAAALEYSGVIKYVGQQITTISIHGTNNIVLLLSSILSVVTTFVGNAALTGVALPVTNSIAIALNISPLLLAYITTISSSCAFMLPMSTPPNAVIFASKYIKIFDMLKAGFFLNIIAIIVITFVITSLIMLLGINP